MEPEAVKPTPLEHEVLELVRHHLHSVEQRRRAGGELPDDARLTAELLRIGQVVRDGMANRQHRAVEWEEERTPHGALPDTLEGKLKLLKQLQDELTTVRPDGTTMAERIKDREGVTRALSAGATLRKQIKEDLEQQRRLDAAAVHALEQMRDTLLLWKVSGTVYGSGGAKA